MLFAPCFCVFFFFFFFFLGFALKAMNDSLGTSQSSSVLKSLYDKVRDILCCQILPNNNKRLDKKLERKIMEISKNASGNSNFKSIDSIIMKFPQIREELTQIRDVFEQYDEDSNGSIDNEELKKCLRSLEFSVGDEEIDDLFHYCDMDGNEGLEFNEFIVLLCLIYLLTDSSSSSHATLKMYWPQVEATFNTIIEVFLFLDKNSDGKLERKDVVKALNQASPREKSPSRITHTRFSN
ncbi:Calmodulin and related proteins (EF-Hand superfamily) [Handroanthus impetiginosus]|uniref:Calmodulin and related proteins (EF-Hand superfamily) n=1 Tax=Handroanthus impetiginosus TaxID=429701 RepID=A0A2G9H196_9LAMI|nr:Calmodulin and related proteins (EF-Hand superfamily) [Handroanthus impetiginosus]